MPIQVAFLTESLPTSLADVGALSCVKALMDDHLVPLGECLLTILARVRPVTCVDTLVLALQITSLKGFGAEGTLVRPLPSVHASGMQQ